MTNAFLRQTPKKGQTDSLCSLNDFKAVSFSSFSTSASNFLANACS